jgi:hypothetical protein
LFLTNRRFNLVRKDRLFYDQFLYCIAFYLEEVSALRVLDHVAIDDTMQRRRQWREIAQQRWVNGRQKHGIILSRSFKEITENTIHDLHVVAEKLLTTTSDFKLVVSVDQGYVYTNDMDLIDTLDHMPELKYKSYTKAKVTRPKNTIQLKNSQNCFRSYFKAVKLNDQQKKQLDNFLNNHKDQVRLSPALTQWIDQPFNRLQDYFFVDYQTNSWLTMLSLVHPGLVRKTMHIIPAK